jgi:hypothetical protein
VPAEVEKEEGESERRLFLLQIVQPGLAGLMDGSVSTLAPLFAAAFDAADLADLSRRPCGRDRRRDLDGFAEALSGNGSLTALGGLGHTLPFLVPSFTVATTIAVAIVVVELAAISWVRNRYMDTPLVSAAFQVFVGGLLVFATGIAIGSG